MKVEDNGSVDNPNEPQVPDNSNNDIINDDKITEENKNDLPKTGQGVFYGVIIAVAVVIIGAGVYLVTKKKK